MKKIFFSLLLLSLFLPVAFASAPNEIRYSGRLKSYQTPVNNIVSMTFKIYYQETGGNSAWTSNAVNVSVSSGIFTYTLKPTDIDWGRGDVWLEVIVGANVLSPREKLMSQPYALYAGNGVPAGTVIAYAGKEAPDGYLLCDGSPVSAAQYPALYKAIGTIYGGSANAFNLPDFRGMFLRGHGTNTVMTTPGGAVSIASEDLGKKQGDSIRNITASWSGIHVNSGTNKIAGAIKELNSAGINSNVGASMNQPNYLDFDASRVAPTSNENRPANYAVKYFIKH